MGKNRIAMLMLAGLLVAEFALTSAGAADKKNVAKPDDVARVAAMIDRHIGGKWKRENVKSAPIAGDAEFMRRVYLSLSGRIPRVAEAHRFLNSTDPDKRRKLVDELLETPGYITHYTDFWRSVMMPEVSADFQARFLIPGFEGWLRDNLQQDTKYDELIKELLTVKFDNSRQRGNFYQRFGESSPMGFYQAKQAKPENLASAVSRMFLGVRIECAQCHDHPFDSWKQDQFWGFAAFFAGFQRNGGDNVFAQVREIADRRELTIPSTKKVVQARFLTGKEPQWRFRQNARETLANWVVAKENPYFAKTAVNRIWGKLFGVGIVDPIDDFSVANSPSHPELLDELAREFVKHNYDMKFLLRAITASKAYQLTSRKTDESQSNPQLFARMAVQAMTPSQLIDSLNSAVGVHEQYQSRNPFVFGRQDARGEIEELFQNDSQSPTERTTTILQSLAMMNGRFMANATNTENSGTLAAVLEFPLLSTAERIEALYLATLSRKPRADELARMTKYVDAGGTKKDSRKALADVFWSLLNSSEFLLNH